MTKEQVNALLGPNATAVDTAITIACNQGYVSRNQLAHLYRERGGTFSNADWTGIRAKCNDLDSPIGLVGGEDVIYSKDWVNGHRRFDDTEIEFVIALDLYRRIRAKNWYRGETLDFDALKCNDYGWVLPNRPIEYLDNLYGAAAEAREYENGCVCIQNNRVEGWREFATRSFKIAAELGNKLAIFQLGKLCWTEDNDGGRANDYFKACYDDIVRLAEDGDEEAKEAKNFIIWFDNKRLVEGCKCIEDCLRARKRELKAIECEGKHYVAVFAEPVIIEEEWVNRIPMYLMPMVESGAQPDGDGHYHVTLFQRAVEPEDSDWQIARENCFNGCSSDFKGLVYDPVSDEVDREFIHGNLPENNSPEERFLRAIFGQR